MALTLTRFTLQMHQNMVLQGQSKLEMAERDLGLNPIPSLTFPFNFKAPFKAS